MTQPCYIAQGLVLFLLITHVCESSFLIKDHFVQISLGNNIGLAPLYRIGPRSDVGGRTGAKSGEVFWSDGGMRRVEVVRRTGAKSGEVFLGRMEGRAADKKRSKNFVLGSPYFLIVKL